MDLFLSFLIIDILMLMHPEISIYKRLRSISISILDLSGWIPKRQAEIFLVLIEIYFMGFPKFYFSFTTLKSTVWQVSLNIDCSVLIIRNMLLK